MSNYFEQVGKRYKSKSLTQFQPQEAEPGALAEFYGLVFSWKERDLPELRRLCFEWAEMMIYRRHNIVVRGPLSKYRLIESFRVNYLEKKEFTKPGATKDEDPLIIETYVLHGMQPVTYEKFIHGVFGVKDKSNLADEDIMRFSDILRGQGRHAVFVIHSVELLIKECPKVVDVIIKLCKTTSDYVHLIMSSDHINAGIILDPLRVELSLIIYFTSCAATPFYFEKLNSTIALRTEIIEDRVTITSLNDLYLAIGNHCRQVMIYILKRHINNQDNIDLEDVLQYCKSRFLSRTSRAIKDHITELSDHRVVRLDASGRSVVCILDVGLCEKFLNELDSENKL